MVYELHGMPGSGNTLRVLVTLAQLDLLNDKDFKMVPLATGFGEMQGDEWKLHQPFGQMPWLRDTETGVELYESRAICRYLAHKIKSPLFVSPADGLEKWIKFEQAASAELTDFDYNAYPLARELVTMPRMFNTPGIQALIDFHKPFFVAKLKGYEVILGRQKYLAGDELTLVDLFCLPFGARCNMGGGADALTDGSMPNVARWWKEVSSLPAWEKAQSLSKPL